MSREEAYIAMQAGKKIRHQYFADGEYYEMKGRRIIAEDGVDHTMTFKDTSGGDWRKDGWEEVS